MPNMEPSRPVISLNERLEIAAIAENIYYARKGHLEDRKFLLERLKKSFDSGVLPLKILSDYFSEELTLLLNNNDINGFSFLPPRGRKIDDNRKIADWWYWQIESEDKPYKTFGKGKKFKKLDRENLVASIISQLNNSLGEVYEDENGEIHEIKGYERGYLDFSPRSILNLVSKRQKQKEEINHLISRYIQ